MIDLLKETVIVFCFIMSYAFIFITAFKLYLILDSKCKYSPKDLGQLEGVLFILEVFGIAILTAKSCYWIYYG